MGKGLTKLHGRAESRFRLHIIFWSKWMICWFVDGGISKFETPVIQRSQQIFLV